MIFLLCQNQRSYFKKAPLKVTPLKVEVSEDLTRDLFIMIRDAALEIAKEKEVFLEGALKHPTQREIIKYFRDRGVRVTERHVGEYVKRMGEKLTFINQKKGFVYTSREVA